MHQIPKIFYFVIKLYMLGASSVPIIKELSTVHSATGTFHAGYVTASNLTLLGSELTTCMKLPIAECTVDNSWWRAKTMPETFRVLWQNKKNWIFDASSWLFSTNLNVCLYSCLNYPAWKSHPSCAVWYCHLCLSGSTIIFHVLS
jgi:hypothetical protein